MILAVDIGNTNIKVGAWDNEHLAFVSRLQTNTLCTREEYAVKLLDIFRLYECNSSQFDGAIISSVVPPLSSALVDAVGGVIQSRRVFLVSPGLKTGLNIKIDNPAMLGADMVCAAVAAIAKYPLPCIIASFGTATAIFALNSSGEFIGGSVAPGIGISLDALSQRAAQLPHISLENPGELIAKNTVDCMKSGIIYGSAAMLDGMVERMKEHLGADATVIATGGFASYVTQHCRQDIKTDDNLLLEGLRIIYHKNVK